MPDAWDDDWIQSSKTDRNTSTKTNTLNNFPVPSSSSNNSQKVKLTREQRMARHEEINRQLWNMADTVPSAPLFIETSNTASGGPTRLKPGIKVLSRNPPGSKPSSRSAVDGSVSASKSSISQCKTGDRTLRRNINGANDEDDDLREESLEEKRKKAEDAFLQRQAIALKEREEKERRYQELRAQLFGPSDHDTFSASSSSFSHFDEQQTRSPQSQSPRYQGRNYPRGGGINSNNGRGGNSSGISSSSSSSSGGSGGGVGIGPGIGTGRGTGPGNLFNPSVTNFLSPSFSSGVNSGNTMNYLDRERDRWRTSSRAATSMSIMTTTASTTTPTALSRDLCPDPSHINQVTPQPMPQQQQYERVSNISLYTATATTTRRTENSFTNSPSAHLNRLPPEKCSNTSNSVRPIREPRGPDSSGRGGFGYSDPPDYSGLLYMP